MVDVAMDLVVDRKAGCDAMRMIPTQDQGYRTRDVSWRRSRGPWLLSAVLGSGALGVPMATASISLRTRPTNSSRAS